MGETMSTTEAVAVITGASQGIGAALVQAFRRRNYRVVATRVDTLVNNAGMFMAKPFTAYSNDDYAAYLATNVTGFFHMTQRAMEMMSKQGRGHVVTVSTSLVDQPMTSVPAVLASLTKGGLNAATKSLAIEYARKGVRVNTVSAGIINAPMHPPEAHQVLASLHPMGRMGEVSDIVDAVMYLESAGFVTGEILHVDGGQAARSPCDLARCA
jgi:NAD(P)-dependent dehydrogenase (short-subunit alcohol dehydrogenase family)